MIRLTLLGDRVDGAGCRRWRQLDATLFLYRPPSFRSHAHTASRSRARRELFEVQPLLCAALLLNNASKCALSERVARD